MSSIADDPLQAALQEAEILMQSLGQDEGVPTSGSFAIDSDDDDDDDGGVNHHEVLHPLHDEFLQYTPNSNSIPTSTTANNSMDTFTSGSATSLGVPQANAFYSPFGGGIATDETTTTTITSTPTSSLLLGSAAGTTAVGVTPVSMDVLKASTSRFASNLANMAQRAANQVVSTAVGTTSTAHPNHSSWTAATALTPSMNYYGTTIPTAAAAATTPATGGGSTPPQQLQQQPHTTSRSVLMPELDTDQKAALIQTHVGDLIPGERVIMFLQNVQHVSDSTGFQYNNNNNSSGNSDWWCCAMTFYRIVLFSTHPVRQPTKPFEWSASCWPSAQQQQQMSILQMPLANMDKVEKSVFTATTTTTNNVGGGFGTLTVGSSFASSSNNNNNNSGNINNTSNNNSGNTNTLTTMTLLGLILNDKLNGRQLRFTTAAYGDTNRAYEALQTYAFPGRRNLGYLFAFESKRDMVMASIETDASTGQKTVTLPPVAKRFDALTEFPRQFAAQQQLQPPWSLWTTTNAAYQVCMSYPSVLVGPVSLDETVYPDADRIIRQCASFRSENRLPALTWCGAGGASIWRCSQPKIGLQGNRSLHDELYLRHIMERAAAANNMVMASSAPILSLPRSVLIQLTGTPDLTNWLPSSVVGLKILDLRPRSSAMANRTGGYGYENTSNYPGCSLQFCNIGNIHAVRDAYQKLSQLCLSTVNADLQFATAVEDTKWLSHMRLLWSAAWETAYWVHVHRLPVLLHCSHGWDRTSQVAALAQLLLDPYYRTMAGFACLVEKDFMSFGHPFHTRCGHGEGRDGAGSAAAGGNNAGSTVDEGQISPIFLQFLDCVYQLVRLYPECFEFNTRYLLCLSDNVYSCRFGNFLCDTERERELVAGIRQRTHSVWDYLEGRSDRVRNRQYNAETAAGVLLMPLPTLLRNMTLWTDRHCMHGPKATTRWLPACVAAERPPFFSGSSNDQPSDLVVTEEETQHLIFSMVAKSADGDPNTTTATSEAPSLDRSLMQSHIQTSPLLSEETEFAT